MYQEEGVMIDYLAKVCELILQMRYDHHALGTGNNQKHNSLQQQGNEQQIGFHLQKQQYRMLNLITEQWNSSCMALTLEFFLKKKSDGSNHCVEQWQFIYEKEFGRNRNNNNNTSTAATSSTGSKKPTRKSEEIRLAMLSRSIASLLVATPLWRSYISSENRTLRNAYILDYKISFSKNQPAPQTSVVKAQDLQLSQGSLTFQCFYVEQLQKILQVTTNIPVSSSKTPLTNISYNNTNSISTANSSPQSTDYPIFNHNTNIKKKPNQLEARERFLSDNFADIKKLLPVDQNRQQQEQQQLYPPSVPPVHMSASTFEINKPSNRLQTDNMTFRFSFSDTEPLSDEEKKIINHHLRKSSVVSVYSRKDDITIVSTPEEIAMKMSDEQGAGDLNGYEIEMVLEEDNSKNSYVHQKQHRNNGNLKSQDSNDQEQFEDYDNKKMISKQDKNQEILAAGLSPSAEDEFDFQFIEEENDRPIDIAIKRLTEIINQHKIQIRTQKEQRCLNDQSSQSQKCSKSAFDMLRELSLQVSSF